MPPDHKYFGLCKTDRSGGIILQFQHKKSSSALHGIYPELI